MGINACYSRVNRVRVEGIAEWCQWGKLEKFGLNLYKVELLSST